MSSPLRKALLPTAAILLGSAALAQTLTTLPAGLSARAMSPDGNWVVGRDGYDCFRWSAATGKVTITAYEAVAVSADGNQVLCTVYNANNKEEAGIYDVAAGTWTMMDTFAGGTSCDFFLTSAYDMSHDGTIATGLAWESCQGRAFHWTGSIPMLKLPQINPGSTRGNAVSGDGQFIGGWETATNGSRVAAIWKPDGTIVHPTVKPGNPDGVGETWGFSTDGSWACGQGGYSGSPAWVWSEITGLIELPILAGSSSGDTHIAKAISDDGKVVIGSRGGVFGNPWRAWIWTESYGMQDLGSLMQALGFSLPAPLIGAEDLTPDGRTILGSFTGPFGFAGDSWIFEFADPVTDLGGSSAGTGGVHPALSATGSFWPSAPFGLHLADASGNALSVLLLSTQNIPVPLFGGTLQAFPLDYTQALLTSPTGEWDINATWPQAMTKGVSLYFQAAVFDPAAVGQFALSNGLQATTP